MTARFYIYRNLNKGTAFSVKHRGVVVDIVEFAFAEHVSFNVSQAGRKRAIREKTRNVHAYVSPLQYTKIKPRHFREKYKHLVEQGREITYNPYKYDSFIYKDNGERVQSAASCILAYGKLYEVKNGAPTQPTSNHQTPTA